MSETLPETQWREAFTVVVYRLAAYSVINLIDDAAMLSLIFV
ncbi:hypothetical protein [Limnohabitans sp.]